MKAFNVALLLFPIAIFGTPIANPESSPNPSVEVTNGLEARADKWCNLHSSVKTAQGCDYDRWSSQRKRTVQLNERFGVRCWSTGQSVNGNTRWDYIPGWGCWISAHWTSDGCESGVPSPC